MYSDGLSRGCHERKQRLTFQQPTWKLLDSKDDGNCEEELPKKPVGRQSADSRPTVGRLSADSWPTDG